MHTDSCEQAVVADEVEDLAGSDSLVVEVVAVFADEMNAVVLAILLLGPVVMMLGECRGLTANLTLSLHGDTPLGTRIMFL
jgi:hypothetical protein